MGAVHTPTLRSRRTVSPWVRAAVPIIVIMTPVLIVANTSGAPSWLGWGALILGAAVGFFWANRGGPTDSSSPRAEQTNVPLWQQLFLPSLMLAGGVSTMVVEGPERQGMLVMFVLMGALNIVVVLRRRRRRQH